MAQPPVGTPGLPVDPQDDSVNLPGVTPITASSFPVGSPPNPGTPQGTVTIPQVDIIGELDNRFANWQALQAQKEAAKANPVTLPEVTVEGKAKLPAPGQFPTPGGPPGSFGYSPLGPREALQAQAQIFADKADADRRAGDALAQGKSEEADTHRAYGEKLLQSIDQSQGLWATAQANQAQREKNMDAAIAKGRQMSVDPDNYWNRKGTASNILAAISIGLGSFGSGMTKGATGNPALTLVNNAIDHDISSQKDNIENYWKSVTQQGHLDDTAFNRALVTQNVMTNMRLAGYKVYESDLKTIAAKTDSQLVKFGTEKQLADAQLVMNHDRQVLAANLAAQAAAGQALSAKDAEGFRKDLLEHMKEHPNMSPQDAAKDIAAIDPGRTARLGAKSALPAGAQDDYVYTKEKGFAGAFNAGVKELAEKNIKQLEVGGHKVTDDDVRSIWKQSSGVLLKQHPEFAKAFRFHGVDENGIMRDIRTPEVPQAAGDPGTPGTGPDRRSAAQIAEDKKRLAEVEVPLLGADGKQQVGQDGQPAFHKVKMLAISPKAAEDYTKWANGEPNLKEQMGVLKKALAEGDRATYEAARGLIIESLPPILGFERAPSEGQIHTTFAGAIPEWKTISNPFTGEGSPEFMAKQLGVAQKMFDKLSASKRENTFGADIGPGRTATSYDLPTTPKFDEKQHVMPSANPNGAPGQPGSPTPGTDPTVTGKSLPVGTSPQLLRTWVDTRSGSPTKGRTLNVLSTSGGPILQDPGDGHLEPIHLNTQDLINGSPLSASELNNRYDAQPRK